MKRLICAAMLLLLLTGCAPQPVSETIFCMDTVMELTVWGADADQALAAVRRILYDQEQTWDVTEENSLLSRINRGLEPSLLPQERLVLERAEALSARTGGAFNPHLQALSACWGFYDQNYRLPTQEEIDQALAQNLWDLGGGMKGYAGELCVRELETLAVEQALLSLGGNVQTYGEKRDGTPWIIGIQNPHGGDPLGILSIRGTMAVVTSGDYWRCFEVDGVLYHHILDPGTGRPADSGLTSVTVLCRDGMDADALSTALFVLGLERGTQLWRESRDFEAVFVTGDGKIYATQGAPLSGCTFEVISR